MIKLEKVEPVHDDRVASEDEKGCALTSSNEPAAGGFEPRANSALEKLAALASEIWFEYWPQFIGEEQTRYMVENFQSAEAIARDITENDYEYFFVKDEKDKIVGYVGVAPERFSEMPDDPRAATHGRAITPLFADRLFISKVYLLAEERGKHYASQILAWLADHARDLGLSGMYLTVNKGNELGIRAYKGNGFEIIESVEADIGEGFVMDDYIMARAV